MIAWNSEEDHQCRKSVPVGRYRAHSYICSQVLNQRYSDKLYKEALDGSLEDVNKLSK